MAQKTFGQAFAEARKQGLDKFEWNGGWYTTKRADETNAQSRATGTVSNRKKVTKNGQTGYVVKEGKDGTLDAGKMGELEVVAPRLKVNRKTSGFQPVDENKNYNKANGDTRLYQERGTGRYLVTDNGDNIVGYSFDPAAATSDANWGGWIAYTGSKNDLKAAGAGKLRDEANRNEVNQKSKQAYDRMTDDRERQMDGIRRMQGGFNTVQGMLNMPNNIITGAIRAGVSDDYSWNDYKDSFTIDGLWRGNSSVGLGDILGIDNDYGRFAANIINPMSVFGTTMKSSTPTYKVGATEGKPIVIKSQSVGSAKSNFRRGSRPNEGMGTNQRGQTQYGGKHNASSNVGPVETAKISTQRYYVDKTPGELKPTPFNAAFRYDPKKTTTYKEETPTAEFYYDGNGNTNTYAKGRISTGKVVPGTSGKNWSGGQSGNKLDVQNTKGYSSPMFGGLTIGSSKDNLSTKGTSMGYLPIGYHKQGKKLILRKKL